ncbi:LysR family transcriptional regulator [Pseudonocardia hispaniensis]|uniref:LysR family transcriptional regulator n=1 Tax=Pseudonocardia hispaniensis TaxID=904933 RepID=A0ABW1J3Q3_9PSEU
MDVPFELRTLRYFVAVAEELHFGRAAARLHIAQPSLSVQIRKLESALGVPLLVRTSRSVSLTRAGETLLAEARSLLADAERIAHVTRHAGERDRRSILVGFQANAAAELTPRILALYAKRYPLRRSEMRSRDLTDPFVGLADGAVDVAFIRPTTDLPDWLSAEVLFREPRVLAVSVDSPLASLSEVTIQQLLDQPFVARNGPDSWRDFWLATEQRGGHTARIGAQISQLEECLEAVIAGRGIGFTQISTLRYYSRPGLTAVPVVDIPPSDVAIAWRSDDTSDLVRDFVETARMVAATTCVPAVLTAADLPLTTLRPAGQT